MQNQFLKRLKSFLWRGAVIALVAFINYILSNIGVLDLPIWAVGFIGLIGGELTKWLNRRYQLGKARREEGMI